VEMNLVLSVYDRSMFSTLSNGQNLFSHGGKQLCFPMLNAVLLNISHIKVHTVLFEKITKLPLQMHL